MDGETEPLAARLRRVLARLLARLRPPGPCLRCHATGSWRGADCPDCGGAGRR